MTFAKQVKDELCKIKTNTETAFAEMYGILLFANKLNFTEIKIITENQNFAELVITQMHNLFSITINLIERAKKDKKTYEIKITDRESINKIFLSLGLNPNAISLSIDYRLIFSEQTRSAFIRGAFLSGGTVATPEKSYHLEFSTPSKNLCQNFFSLLLEIEIADPKIVNRKSNYVIYYKDSSAIEDILNIMGAKQGEFSLINIKIEKQIRNDANRATNCALANISKIVETATKQINAINQLYRTGRFELLPDDLRELAELRIDNPEMSMSELGEILTPMKSKTAVYNSLKKIVEF